MTSPIGVLSRDDGSVVLIYDEFAVPVDALADQIQRQQSQTGRALRPDTPCEPLWSLPRPLAGCSDPDCHTPGCWASGDLEAETYHCTGCYEAFDTAFQCLAENKRCPRCCGRQACIEAGILRMGIL